METLPVEQPRDAPVAEVEKEPDSCPYSVAVGRSVELVQEVSLRNLSSTGVMQAGWDTHLPTVPLTETKNLVGATAYRPRDRPDRMWKIALALSRPLHMTLRKDPAVRCSCKYKTTWFFICPFLCSCKDCLMK